MKNYVQSGDLITVAAPAAVASGDIVRAGSLIGIAAGAAASGADVVLSLTGVFDLPKASGAITLGAVVYHDAATGNVTTTASGNVKLGVAIAAAGSGAATARIRLNGSF
jgi:predicted RecA/RadA family phage recombinase